MTGQGSDAHRFASAELRPLLPWADAFGDMPDEEIRLLGSLLAAITPLIETADDSLRSGLDELDGFDDVIAAGPLERLIPSEFLWLKAMPIEFVRRIAEREALRRRPVYQDPADDRGVVLLLDSGPAMLGRRRLAALAALFAIGVATRRRGARLLWSSTGFSRAPLWFDGVDRRGLARFMGQTATRLLTPEFCTERLEALATPRESDAFWFVGPSGTSLEALIPDFSITIDEPWPDARPPGRGIGDASTEGSDADRADRPASLRISLHAGDELRRQTDIALPEEQLCAAALRAPFQVRAGPKTGSEGLRSSLQDTWAPRLMSQEGDGGAVTMWLGNELVVRGPGHRRLRITLPEGAELMGVRAAAQTSCTVVWRQESELYRALITQPARDPEIRMARLSPDHPLLIENHPPETVPLLFRFGRADGVNVASPSGQIYSLAAVDEWTSETLGVTPLEHAGELRVRAWATNALLCMKTSQPERAPVLRRLRTSRQSPLDFESARPISGAVRQCVVVGEIGGALIADDQGVFWAPPPAAFGAEPPPQPEIAADAIILNVTAPRDARTLGGGDPRDLVWHAVVWSPDLGLMEHRYDKGAWAQRAYDAPAVPGQIVAMARVGKVFYALSDTDAFDLSSDDGGLTLFQFRRGDEAVQTCLDAGWLAEAPCVAL
jgi:hypothetical protein